jgi:hypothetical protein
VVDAAVFDHVEAAVDVDGSIVELMLRECSKRSLDNK